jgi:hypothetical protein
MTWPFVLAVATGLVAAALRFLSTTGFPNDHFVALTRGVQMLYGEWPVRDFVDPGLPMMYVVSAVAQAVGGRTLYAEALLVAAAFGISAGLTAWVVYRWCGSALLGLWAAFAEFAIFPRSYSYPKVLLYVVAAWAFVAYARHPTTTRLIGLAALSLIAFLFRHDHGLFIGGASLVLVAAVAFDRGVKAAAGVALRFAAVTGAFVAPYLAFIQMHGGLRAYAASALEFSRVEADRTALDGWPMAPSGFSPWSAEVLSAFAYYVVWALPLLAVLTLLLNRRRMTWRERGIVLACAVLAVAVNAAFLRDPLTARLSDAVVPAVLLIAWLGREVWQAVAGRPAVASPVRALLVTALVVIASASAEIGAVAEQMNRASANRSVVAMAERWVEVRGELREPFNDRHMPSALNRALIPFFTYVQACTSPDDRLLVVGFAPEVPYYAGRAFAGGHVNLFGGYYSSESDQRALLRRLRDVSVPLVVIPPDSAGDFQLTYPLVYEWVSTAYQLMAAMAVDGDDEPARVYIRRELASRPVLQGTSWPCGTPAGGDLERTYH